LEVHGSVESKDIDAWEAGSEEGTHPIKKSKDLLNFASLLCKEVTKHLHTLISFFSPKAETVLPHSTTHF
jgi:hypothetical protein